MAILEIEESWTGEYLWRFKADNGKVVSHGETYQSKQGAIDGALVGSPVVWINEDNETMTYAVSSPDGADLTEIEGTVRWIKTEPPVKREVTPVIGTQPEIVQIEVDGNSLRRDDSGHYILENYLVLHPKHPDEPRCAIPSCQMAMEVL